MKDNVLYFFNYNKKFAGNIRKHKIGLVIRNGSKNIVSDLDLIHWVEESKDIEIEVNLQEEKEDGTISFSYDTELVKLSENELDEIIRKCDIKKDVAYFGIKDRILRNYNLFQKSVAEIGCNINFPEWR